MAEAGKIKIVEYPDKNEQQPGPLMFIWPATLQVDNQELFLFDAFATFGIRRIRHVGNAHD